MIIVFTDDVSSFEQMGLLFNRLEELIRAGENQIRIIGPSEAAENLRIATLQRFIVLQDSLRPKLQIKKIIPETLSDPNELEKLLYKMVVAGEEKITIIGHEELTGKLEIRITTSQGFNILPHRLRPKIETEATPEAAPPNLEALELAID